MAIVGQPIFSLSEGRIVGYEALSRFPALPDLTPDEVFRIAVEQGVGLELEEEAVRQALSYLPEILRRSAFLTVNASPAAAAAPAIRRTVERFAPKGVVLEITDQGQVVSYIELGMALVELRVGGLRVAISASGAVSPAGDYMADLRPDMIKLDGALTVEVDSDPVRQAMVRALTEFARGIDALVVAGQVETPVSSPLCATLVSTWRRATSSAARSPSTAS